MKIKDLIGAYYGGYSGTGHCQVLEVDLIDDETGEILFRGMRVEGFMKLVNPNLEVKAFYATAKTPRPITSEECRRGIKREVIRLIIHAPVMTDVPPYYSDVEWECLHTLGKDED